MKIPMLILFLFAGLLAFSQNNSRPFIDSVQYKTLRVKPSITNKVIHTWDTAHAVYYDAGIKANKILLFLAGTNGTPLNVPVEFFNTALEQGYRVIALSYITAPGVSQICIGNVLDTDIGCAASFRRKRIYGDTDFSLINDEPQDAIIPRFINLLNWLIINDASGNWQQYLDKKDGKPVWEKIAVAGQSQGGGMAEFLGQQEVLARVISFSGGWDYASSKEKIIAGWYANAAITPLQNWYAAYNVNEVAANQLSAICTALQIPEEHIFALDKPLMNEDAAKGKPNPYHTDGIRNTAYKTIWIKMLGSGAD